MNEPMTETTSTTPAGPDTSAQSPPQTSPVAAAIAQLRATAEPTAEAEVEQPTDQEAEDEQPAEIEDADDAEAPADHEDPEATGEEGEEETDGEGSGEDGEDAEEDSEDGDAFVFQIPGRGPDDPDLELELEGLTREQREGILRLRKGYMRREHFNQRLAQVQADQEELQSIEREIASDPAAFIQERVKDPEIVRNIALDHLVGLLEEDSRESRQAYQQFIERLAELEEDPVRRENHILRRGQPKGTRKQEPPPERDSAAADGITSQDPDVNAVLEHLRSAVPPGTTPARARAYMELALTAVHEHMIEEGITDTITAEDLDQLTADVRRTFRFENRTGAGRRGKSAGAHGRSAPAPKKASAPKDPRETGKRLARASVRRREAATVPAGGAAPPAAPTPVPKGGGVREALAALRNNMGE